MTDSLTFAASRGDLVWNEPPYEHLLVVPPAQSTTNSTTSKTEDTVDLIFRDYQQDTSIADFYRENHEKQTVTHVLAMKAKYEPLDKARMSIWEALEVLDTLVDDSDPDTHLSQMAHAFQSAEAARKDNQPDWLVLVALIHDLGKYLLHRKEPQWTVVGDTFPVGCRYSDKIVYRDFLSLNPDHDHPVYSTEHGMYTPGCGLNAVHLSYGHDEYLYHVCKSYLPPQALYIIRFHSFYSCHREDEYGWLLSDHDRAMMPYLKMFNQYDLYSKADTPPCRETLEPFYKALVAKYFPEKIDW
ncbi:inositol oxygenase [Spinellus fusiger]|nr:inositol oxygenase [Spinellus fusiger]